MKKKDLGIITVLTLCTAAGAQNYSVDRYVMASGGGHSESAVYLVDGTVGQPVVGRSASESYIVEAGFWAGLAGGGDCLYIAGDVDNNGTPLELADVIAMIGNYRGTTVPYFVCDCPGHAADFAATADPSGNCAPFELGDVVIEIGAYRGTADASACPDCPGTLRLRPGERNSLTVIPSLRTKKKAEIRQQRE